MLQNGRYDPTPEMTMPSQKWSKFSLCVQLMKWQSPPWVEPTPSPSSTMQYIEQDGSEVEREGGFSLRGGKRKRSLALAEENLANASISISIFCPRRAAPRRTTLFSYCEIHGNARRVSWHRNGMEYVQTIARARVCVCVCMWRELLLYKKFPNRFLLPPKVHHKILITHHRQTNRRNQSFYFTLPGPQKSATGTQENSGEEMADIGELCSVCSNVGILPKGPLSNTVNIVSTQSCCHPIPCLSHMYKLLVWDVCFSAGSFLVVAVTKS